MSIKSIIRSSVKRLLPPDAAESVANLYRRARYPLVRRRLKHMDQVLRALGRPTNVLQGPFAGMAYISRAHCSSVVAKVLGTYEMELHPLFERVIAAAPANIVDIGAAEGYYAVGLARRLPKSRVVAFELWHEARDMLDDLAKRNGVRDRIELLEAADPAGVQKVLARVTAAQPFVICDVEGYEDVLMNPLDVPGLRSATILIEVHEEFAPGIGGRLRERFAATHDLEVIDSRPRTRADLPEGATTSDQQAVDAMFERETPMQWYVFTPRAT